MTELHVEPIRGDLPFGSRVRGVTRDQLADEAVRAQLNELFWDRGLLVFSDVEPSGEMQVALSEVFGPLKDHPSEATPRVEGLLGVIEIKHDPDAAGMVEVDGQRLASWLPWHFDHCYNDELNRAGVLRSVEGPPEGGLTGFADGIALHQAISPELRERIEGREVLYAMDVILENLTYGRPPGFREIQASSGSKAVMEEYAGRPRAIHPAVWERATGEKVLHVSPWMAKGIVGMDGPEGDDLLHAISDEIVAVAETMSYFHRWSPTDMVIWDNWRVLHRVSGMAPEHARCMHRTTIKGDYGLGRFEAVAG
jgi:taurine dioxygenase